MCGEFDHLPTAVAFGNPTGMSLVLFLLVSSATSRARLVRLAYFLSVMFRKARVTEEESIAQVTEDVGFSFVSAIGAILTSTLTTHCSATGTVTWIVVVERSVAFVTPVAPVDESGKRSASIVMGV